MTARRIAADCDARNGYPHRLRHPGKMRYHRIDIRKHFREGVNFPVFGIAEHIIHRRYRKTLFGHLSEQLDVPPRLAAALPRAAVHKKEERGVAIYFADIPGQIEVVRLRGIHILCPLAQLPPAVLQVIAHVRLRAPWNLRGVESNRRHGRISGGSRGAGERKGGRTSHCRNCEKHRYCNRCRSII